MAILKVKKKDGSFAEIATIEQTQNKAPMYKYSYLKRSDTYVFDWAKMKECFSEGGMFIFDTTQSLHFTDLFYDNETTYGYSGYYFAAPGSIAFAYYNTSTSICTISYFNVGHLTGDNTGDTGWVSWNIAVDESDYTHTWPEEYWVSSSTRHSNCFTGDTLVHTPDGIRRIDELRVGDLVYSYNTQSNVVEAKKVTGTESNAVCEVFTVLAEEEIKTTKEHRFYNKTDNAWTWMGAGRMPIGSHLFTIEQKEIPVVETGSKAMDTVVYNIEVEDNHNYFVSSKGFLVHNAKEPL